MRTTQQLSITLPHEMAELVRNKVASGQYATESEVLRDGLRALAERDEAVERWLREEVAPAYDRLKANPKSAIPISKVRSTLARLHKKRLKKAR
jgi:antitoxin ParD1/3/4